MLVGVRLVEGAVMVKPGEILSVRLFPAFSFFTVCVFKQFLDEK